MSTGQIGAIAELRSAAELMRNGFEAYRALSQASSADILAIKDGKVYRFEVRSATRKESGELTFPKRDIRAENLALFVHRENLLTLQPEVPIPFCESS